MAYVIQLEKNEKIVKNNFKREPITYHGKSKVCDIK